MKLKEPSLPKTEEEFIRYQREYLAYLKKVNAAKRAGKNVSGAIKKIERRWIEAGIMDSRGHVRPPYEKVIVNK